LVQQTTFSKDDNARAVSPSAASRPATALLKDGWVRYGLRVARILIVALAALLGLGFLLFSTLIEQQPGGDVRRADAIVVLTGSDGRIPEGVKLLARGKGKRLLISGVNPATKRKELASLAPGSQHLFLCCVDLGREARDTVGNADEAGTWVRERQYRSLILVTSSFHMPRSLAELRRTVPDAELIPYSVQMPSLDGWWWHPGTLQLLATEYVKFLPAFARCLGVQLGRGAGVSGSVRQCRGGVSAP
jgi:uncharacterized SAM-binding protein YcdF (DUF218 family)